MILNIAFTHPEKIYKGNKTVTNSEGNVVRLSRQKWMSVCSWRNALQGCSWRAWLGPALCRGLLSCALTPSFSFSKFSEPVLPTRQRLEKTTEASNCCCVYANLFLPQFCDLSVMGEPFATLQRRPVAWKLQEEDDEKIWNSATKCINYSQLLLFL